MNQNDLLYEAAVETFSDMAFLDVARIDEIGITGASHVVEIGYDGPELGSIVLILPLACKKAIVENIFGDSWQDIQGEAIDDCILELVNVLAGEYLKRRFEPEVKRELSLPRLVFDISEMDKRDQEDHLFLDAEGTPFEIVHHYSIFKH